MEPATCSDVLPCFGLVLLVLAGLAVVFAVVFAFMLWAMNKASEIPQKPVVFVKQVGEQPERRK